MLRRLIALLVAGALMFAAETSRADVVVAIRDLQPKGVSQSHLHLSAQREAAERQRR
jgi:hypothetical protein